MEGDGIKGGFIRQSDGGDLFRRNRRIRYRLEYLVI
jgi:hypothetical protein